MSMLAPRPAYEFVQVSAPGSKRNSKPTRAVRQHVMLNYLRKSAAKSKYHERLATFPTSPADDDACLIGQKGTIEGGCPHQKEPKSARSRHRTSSHVGHAPPVDTLPAARQPRLHDSVDVELRNVDSLSLSTRIRGAAGLDELALWRHYTSAEDGDSSHWSDRAKAYHIDHFWPICCGNETTSHVFSCFVALRMAAATRSNQKPLFYQHTGQIIVNMKSQLHKHTYRRVPMTNQDIQWLVIGMTALMSFAVNFQDYHTAQTHLQGILRLADNLNVLHENVWLYIMVTDLRLASILIQPPTLPFYITSSCRRGISLTPQEFALARDKATHNLEFLPASSELFDSVSSFSVFRNLHEFCLLDTMPNTDIPGLWGHWYKAGHQLCTLQSQMSIACDAVDPFDANEIVLLTAQMTFWGIMRPIIYHDEMEKSLLQRLKLKLSRADDPLQTWLRFAKVEALIWVLFIACISGLDGTVEKDDPTSTRWRTGFFARSRASIAEARPIRLSLEGLADSQTSLSRALARIVAIQGIDSYDKFEAIVRPFPWVGHWMGQRCPLVWQQICAINSEI